MIKHFAFDIDDTLTDSHSLDLLYLKEYLHTDDPEVIASWYSKDWAVRKPFYELYQEEMIPQYELKEDAYEVLKRLKRHQFILTAITVRGNTTHIDDNLTIDYLRRHDIPTDNIILRCFEKMKACKEIGAGSMADDSAYVMEQLRSSGIIPFHFSTNSPYKEDKEIIVVSSWLEIEKYLMEMEEKDEYSKYYVKK